MGAGEVFLRIQNLLENEAYLCHGNRQHHQYNFRENYIYKLKGKAHKSKSKNLDLQGGRGLFCDLSRSCFLCDRSYVSINVFGYVQ